MKIFQSTPFEPFGFGEADCDESGGLVVFIIVIGLTVSWGSALGALVWWFA